jgi:hypothetical protein
LEVRYRSCVSGNVVTELVTNQISINNGDGTFTYIICVDQTSSYSSPVCVQGAIEVSCPVSWVMGASCGGGGGTTTTTTTTAAPGGSFTVNNVDGTGTIDAVTTGGTEFIIISTGNYPLSAGQSLSGTAGSLTGASVTVSLSTVSVPGCLFLNINGVLTSIAANTTGDWTFSGVTFTSTDTVSISYFSGECP